MEQFNQNTNIILVDWGTTNLRAYLFSIKKNKAIKFYNSDEGITKLRLKNDYLEILEKILINFKVNLNIPIFLAGMVGSKNGLVEIPYRTTPASKKNIGQNIISKKMKNMKLFFIPGLSYHKKKFFDVIRGEETIAIGAMKIKKDKNFFICCPGTHSKWIKIKNNKIILFETYLTGDLFSSISNNTILSKSMSKSGKFSKKYFLFALKAIKESSLSYMLFKVRTMNLFNQSNQIESESYLSGLIIGEEIKNVLKKINKNKVYLISEGKLLKFYLLAFNYFKIEYKILDYKKAFISGAKELYEQL